MGLDITGIGSAVQGIASIVDHFVPNKTAEQAAQIQAMMVSVQAQTDIDKAEAQSSDPLQHWRGALGWVCAAGYAYNFVIQPLIVDISTAVAAHPILIHPLDISELSTLTLAMLGLGGLHVAERIKGVS